MFNAERSKPEAIVALDELFKEGCAVSQGAELTNLPLRYPRWRRKARGAAAIGVALIAHAVLLLVLLSAKDVRIRPLTDTLGTDFGAQGISLSLVTGGAGGAFDDSQTDRGLDSDLASGSQTPPEPASGEGTQVQGLESAEQTSEGLGHRVGGIGGASGPSATAANGSGFNPAVLASLAPLSFTKSSEPGLLPQVLRCLRTPLQREVTLNVVLREGGVFVNAYPPDDQPDAGQTAQDASSAQSVVEALKACSPYTDVPAGLSQRLLLVVPQGEVSAAAG